MLALPDETARPRIVLSAMNFGAYPPCTASRGSPRGSTPRTSRSPRRAQPSARRLDAAEALALGLVTAAPDDLDWDDEVRIAVEERASLSPDALTGMEANLRFGARETMETRIFGAAVRVAELDLRAAQRRRRGGRAQGLRHRQQSQIQLGQDLA